ncbi:hypothetical protein HMPREF9548_03923 [Escherichia coli MS 182-1]|nr:hypothetical protein HMPREF9548_03923 [Escherichia coli MS 182-1]
MLSPLARPLHGAVLMQLHSHVKAMSTLAVCKKSRYKKQMQFHAKSDTHHVMKQSR